MRINQITNSDKFQGFLNTFSFLMMLLCFAAVILLPLPYKREEPGGISLQPDPKKAPPIIALCVVVPFLGGIIFLLIYKITYKKSKSEVLKELDENVEFNFISNETKYQWEMELETHTQNKKEREIEIALKRKENYLKMKQKERELDRKIDLFERGEFNVQKAEEDFAI